MSREYDGRASSFAKHALCAYVSHVQRARLFTTENHVAKIMSAKRAFAVSTGMSALDVIVRLVRTGEEIIAGDDLYGGG